MKNKFKKFYKIFLAGACLISIGLLSYSFSDGDTMKLINTKTGFVVVEFKDGKPLFHDRFLKIEMKEEGIFVPPYLRDQFEGKEVILEDDPLFQKAFEKIYYPNNLNPDLYKWED